jgi:hypothetical protein
MAFLDRIQFLFQLFLVCVRGVLDLLLEFVGSPFERVDGQIIALTGAAFSWEIEEEPDQDHAEQNQRAGTADKRPAGVENPACHRSQRGPFVDRHFHDENGRISPQQRPFQSPRHQRGHNQPNAIHGEEREALDPPRASGFDKRGDQEQIDRQPGGTAHQRGDQDRRQAVATVFDHPRRHDSRHRAGHRRQHGYKRLAAQSATRHQAIHQECRPGHVTAIFKHGDEREQD